MEVTCASIAMHSFSSITNRTRAGRAFSARWRENFASGALPALSVSPRKWFRRISWPMHIRKDDIVEVIAGDDAGTAGARTTGRVLRVLHDKHKVVVEGINRVYKHLRPD